MVSCENNGRSLQYQAPSEDRIPVRQGCDFAGPMLVFSHILDMSTLPGNVQENKKCVEVIEMALAL